MHFKIPASIIISFIEANFVSHKITSTGEYRVNSPFINDTKYHLYINPEKGVVCDFKSGYAGPFNKFVADFLDVDNTKVIAFLIREYSGKNIEDVKEVIVPNAVLKLPENIEFFSIKKNGLVRNIAYNYLVNRGIPKKNIEKLGYIFDEASDYNNTIFIPFYENGNIVYYVCRYFDKNPMRYNNPKGVNSKQFIYNIDDIKENGTIFIFEGIFCALSLDKQVGTAMLSSDMGKEQAIKILDTAPKNIIFVPDNDEAGQKSLNRNINLLLRYKPPSLNINILVYYIKDAKDFNETGKHYIDLLECEKWKKFSVDKNKFRRKEII